MNAFTYGHIKAALEQGLKLAKEIGTDEQIGKAKYALQLLALENDGYAPTDPFMIEQCELHGCD